MRVARVLPFVAAVLAGVLAVADAVAPAPAEAMVASTASATPADFDPGNIVSDAVFYDPGTMTGAQVQAFLNTQGAACVAGEQPCLKDYRVSTPSMPAQAGLCAAYAGVGGAGESAAQILSKVATACGINPRVLLVLLQKESSLVTKTRPTSINYRSATGYGCPDTAACDANYYGLFNQLYRAARQYRVYRNNPTRYGYQAGRLNTILYHPDRACGSSSVYIVNQATAGLYIYTPYQPNAAALASWTGTGDACSSYGNRNFFRIFSDWFGDPRGPTAVLARATGTSAVYLVDGASKRRVADAALLAELQSKLGGVSDVAAATLNAYPTAADMQRLVRNPKTGELLWISQGRLSWCPTCATVEAWSGKACGASYVEVSASVLGRLSRGPNIPAFTGTAASVVSMASVFGNGWMPWAAQGQTVGTTGQARALEAVSVNYVGAAGSSLECRAHVANLGWLGWTGQSSICGTTGQNRQLEAVQLRLTGPDAATKKVWYRAHVANRGWLPWTSASGIAGTTGLGLRAEAIQVVVQPASAPAPGTPVVAGPLEYRAHVAWLGWQGWVRDGATAGTTGQSRALEAIAVQPVGAQPWAGAVECSAHTANLGWLGWVGAGATCGTTGRSLQLEAVKLRLTGDLASHMDVWYRVHSQNWGWGGWARNGDPAGTQGFGYRAEAVQVRYLPKGSAAPGPTTNTLRVR